MPFLLMLHPANVTVPEAAFFGFAEQVRVTPPGAPVTNRVTAALLVVTVFPLESWTLTTGCVAKGAEPSAFDGLAWKTSLLAAPGVTVTVVLVADERVPDVAVSV